MDGLAGQLKAATEKLEVVKQQLLESNAEVAQAQLANAANTPQLPGDAVSTVAAMQQLLQGAHNSVQQGQDRNAVGGAILDQLVGHVQALAATIPRPTAGPEQPPAGLQSAAFRQPPREGAPEQPAPGGLPAPASTPARMDTDGPAAWGHY